MILKFTKEKIQLKYRHRFSKCIQLSKILSELPDAVEAAKGIFPFEFSGTQESLWLF
jgi:hypothetical protein